jgi:hypothetical protein
MAAGLLSRILRRHSSDARKRGSVLRRFARKAGLVYFGSVDQHVDEHEIIRGLTVSTTHRDDHYAVGTFDGYDISLVDRFDVIMDPRNQDTEHSWVILQISLERPQGFPHLFFSPVGHGEDAYSKFYKANNQLKPVNDLFRGAHSPEFHSRYQLHMSASLALETEKVLTPEVTQTIAARLWPHAIEVFDGKLYVYTTGVRITDTLLSSCLESALWLARKLDQSEEG